MPEHDSSPDGHDRTALVPLTGGATMPRRDFLLGTGLKGVGLVAAIGSLPFLTRRVLGDRPASLEAGRPLLGTWVRVVARHPEPERASRAIERAFAAVRQVDAEMSLHRTDSALSLVNRAAGEAAVTAPPALLDVVERACLVAERSDGIYDPTILPLMRLYGFYASGRCGFPSDREIAAALDVTGWRRVRIDRTAGTIGLERRGMALDLGSIGKGWALDRAVDALRAAGIRSGLVDVGGNVYGLGTPEDGAAGWTVGVLHPVTGALERSFVLRDRAVATSGNLEQHHRLGDETVGHLLDARRGRPASGHLSVSVVADSGTDSDDLSTVAYLLGPDRFRGWPEARVTHFVG